MKGKKMNFLKNVNKNNKLMLTLLVVAIVLIAGYMFLDKNMLFGNDKNIPKINTKHNNVNNSRNVREAFQNNRLSAEDLRPRNGETIVALFYVDWCGYCKKFKPVFTSAMEKMNSSNKNIRLVKVDCEANRELSKQYEVNGYPTVILIRDGEETVLEVDRTEEGFMRQLNSL